MFTWALYERHLQDIGPASGSNIPRRLINCTMAGKLILPDNMRLDYYTLIFKGNSTQNLVDKLRATAVKRGPSHTKQEVAGCPPELRESQESSRMMSWFVYILRCSDNSLYCGITTDLDRRIEAHNSGTGARYTRSRLPVQLVWHVQTAEQI